ncbi:MAG: 30S ribosomal protein S8 [Candidatus Levybacteria bacterium CG10_big_fil_rev_8_21_14_0_10_36_7]|nr:MAG: 30S ribosomal protein S8 [Candidatus Levybacteria bacterium CG10_big_fil_rev_8_21_14_0_10_36_7]
MNYPIGDFLIRIKNAYLARQKSVNAPFSKGIMTIAKILQEENYVKTVKETEEEGKKFVSMELLYNEGNPAVNDIKIISKPSVHYYMNKNKIKSSIKSYGIGIVSTSKGVMTSRNAQKNGVGGELICQIF